MATTTNLVPVQKLVLVTIQVLVITALVKLQKQVTPKPLKIHSPNIMTPRSSLSLVGVQKVLMKRHIFNASSEFYTSYFVPFGTGYAPFLMGKVVDMFYFPLIVTTWPEWVPYVGGNPYVFFSPIFNFADSSISVGVVLLLLFYRKEISEITLKKKDEA